MIHISPEDLYKLMDKKIVIYDLDMTLLDARKRFMIAMEKIGYQKSTPYYKLPKEIRMRFWEAFLNERYMIYDKPINHIIQELRLKYRDNKGIIILTGRPAKLERITREQLKKFHIPCHLLLMRPNDNYEPDYILKPKIVDLLISYGLEIIEYHDDNIKTLRRIIGKYRWIKGFHHKIRDFKAGFGFY